MQKWILVPALAVLCLFGCSKAADSKQPFDIQGVKVDMPKLREAFSTAGPDLQMGVNEVGSAIRYGMYPKAVAELEKLGASPNLTEPQKKAVEQVTAQVKQLASSAAPPPAK